MHAAALVVALVAAAPAAAKVTAAEAARLGAELTPLGATRAGNESGTIPAWEGGIKEPPPGYRRGKHLVDPFPDDKPLFTITADNFEKYEANLTPGQIAVIQRYPKSYRMPVYQTRRTASLPAAHLRADHRQRHHGDAHRGRQRRCERRRRRPLSDRQERPRSHLGNHLLRYRGKSAARYQRSGRTHGGRRLRRGANPRAGAVGVSAARRHHRQHRQQARLFPAGSAVPGQTGGHVRSRS